jgi:hypothetical protein
MRAGDVGKRVHIFMSYKASLKDNSGTTNRRL